MPNALVSRGHRAIVRTRARDWKRTFQPLHVFGGQPILESALPVSAVSGKPLHLTLDVDLSDDRLSALEVQGLRRLAILSNQHVESGTEPLFVRHHDGGAQLELISEPDGAALRGVPDEYPQLPVDLVELTDAEAAVEFVDEFPDDHGPLHQVGGHPVWIHRALTPPRCPVSGKRMRYVATVDSIRRLPLRDGDVSLLLGDGGMLFVFWSDDASVSASIAQSR